MRIELSAISLHDLGCIGDYIAQDSPQQAKIFVSKLRNQCVKISKSPQAYRLRTELGENIRSSAYGNYVIFFVRMQMCFASCEYFTDRWTSKLDLQKINNDLISI